MDSNIDKAKKIDVKKKLYPIFPFYLPEDTYDVLRENQVRQRLIHEAKMISEEWKPAKKNNVLEKVSRFRVSEIIDELKRCLKGDWPQSKFIIGMNESEEISVIFEFDGTQIGILVTYMNSLINDERITRYQLKRSIDQWAKKDEANQTIQFVFKPPWVRSYHYETFYKASTSPTAAFESRNYKSLNF